MNGFCSSGLYLAGGPILMEVMRISHIYFEREQRFTPLFRWEYLVNVRKMEMAS
jgi:hypothetical protein